MFKIVVLCLIGIINISAFASPISSQIAFQGILSDGNGNPVKDSSGYSLTFVLDTTESGATTIWTEVHSAVTTKQGVFSVMLGSMKSLDTLKFDKQYWLGIKRDNGGLVGQKIKLGVTPYSKRAMIADSSIYAAVAGSVESRNIIGKIDSSKVGENAITSSKIQNGTILSVDVDASFKAPKAAIADTANVATTVPDGSIGTSKISSISGGKIVDMSIDNEKLAFGGLYKVFTGERPVPTSLNAYCELGSITGNANANIVHVSILNQGGYMIGAKHFMFGTGYHTPRTTWATIPPMKQVSTSNSNDFSLEAYRADASGGPYGPVTMRVRLSAFNVDAQPSGNFSFVIRIEGPGSFTPLNGTGTATPPSVNWE